MMMIFCRRNKGLLLEILLEHLKDIYCICQANMYWICQANICSTNVEFLIPGTKLWSEKTRLRWSWRDVALSRCRSVIVIVIIIIVIVIVVIVIIAIIIIIIKSIQINCHHDAGAGDPLILICTGPDLYGFALICPDLHWFALICKKN